MSGNPWIRRIESRLKSIRALVLGETRFAFLFDEGPAMCFALIAYKPLCVASVQLPLFLTI